MLRQASTVLSITTPGLGLHDITEPLIDWVERQEMAEGLLTLFVQHTSCSLVVQENADPDVKKDLDAFFRKLVPEGRGLYRHAEEGPDDMPAHIKAALTAVQLSVPLLGGTLALGTWQGIYLFEHRHIPHERRVVLHLLGE